MKRKRIWTYLAAITAILCIGAFIGIVIGMPIGATKGRKEAEEAYKRQEQVSIRYVSPLIRESVAHDAILYGAEAAIA